jgi:hypothetical protein
VDEADYQVASEDGVGVDVPGRSKLFGGEVEAEAGSVVEDVDEVRLLRVEVAPGG